MIFFQTKLNKEFFSLGFFLRGNIFAGGGTPFFSSEEGVVTVVEVVVVVVVVFIF